MWSNSTIKTILHDEIYIGIVKWNTTMNERDPESGKNANEKGPKVSGS